MFYVCHHAKIRRFSLPKYTKYKMNETWFTYILMTILGKSDLMFAQRLLRIFLNKNNVEFNNDTTKEKSLLLHNYNKFNILSPSYKTDNVHIRLINKVKVFFLFFLLNSYSRGACDSNIHLQIAFCNYFRQKKISN